MELKERAIAKNDDWEQGDGEYFTDLLEVEEIIPAPFMTGAQLTEFLADETYLQLYQEYQVAQQRLREMQARAKAEREAQVQAARAKAAQAQSTPRPQAAPKPAPAPAPKPRANRGEFVS